jgi:hypothetical protein
MVYIYIIFFSVWFVFSVFWQFERFRNSNVLRFFNKLNILPIWTFFAPRPGITDLHLLFRDRKADNSCSDWTEIDVFEKRETYHFLWNPLKRNNKLIVDALSQLKTLKKIQEEKKRSG